MASMDKETRKLPRGSSSSPSEDLFDERDFDSLPSVIPDSMPANKPQANHAITKPFAEPEDEISEEALASGFSWQPRQPPRPGQFCQRPQKAINMLAEDEAVHVNKTVPVVPDGQDALRSFGRPQAAPLALPEFSAVDHSSHRTLHKPSSRFSSPDVLSLSDNHRTPTNAHHFAHQAEQPPISLNNHTAAAQLSLGPRPKDVQRALPGATTFEASVAQSPGAKISSTRPAQERPVMSPSSQLMKNTLRAAKTPPKTSSPTLCAPHILAFKSQKASGSICGDLEVPTSYQNPAKHARASQDRRRDCHNPVALPPASQEQDRPNSRSQSQASNVSRRRSRAEKKSKSHHQKRSMDRKRAMVQAAQHWNNCLEIANQETEDAQCEIQRLMSIVQQQEVSLSSCGKLLKEREAEVKVAEEHANELRTQQATLSNDNEHLRDETKRLQDELETSQTRTAGLEEKYRTYRTKLNEAISEQQSLFTRSKEFYKEMIVELKDEQKRRIEISETMERSLKVSAQKRQEVRECMAEIQAETQKELLHKNEMIAYLKQQNRDSNLETERQREVVESLRLQLQDQSESQAAFDLLGSTVETGLKVLSQEDEHREKQIAFNEKLDERLNQMMVMMKSTSASKLTEQDLSTLLESQGESLANRILPAITTATSNQAIMEDAIAELGTSIHHGIEQLGVELNHYQNVLTDDREESQQARTGLLSLIQNLEDGLGQAEKAWAHIQKELETATTCTQVAVVEPDASSIHTKLAEQFLERIDTITQLQSQFQLTTEDYADKVSELRGHMVEERASTRSMLQDSIAQLGETLSNKMGQEQEKLEKKLLQSEKDKQHLEQELQDARCRLDELDASAKSDMESMEANLHQERNTVSELKDKVRYLEEDVAKAEMFRDKWRKDIQAADTIRAQLCRLKNRLPHLDQVTAKLDGIERVSEAIQTTASRLAMEQTWIQEQLVARDTQSGGSDAGYDADRDTSSNPSTHASYKSTTDSSLLEESTQTDSYTSVQSDDTRRRVTIFSPGGAIKLPHAPPSVAQEQARRRVRTKPQSILKTSTQQAESSQEAVEEPLVHPASQSQYNRPVVGLRSSTTSSAEGMVRKIRSGFVQLTRTKSDLTFPTLADFEKDSHSSFDKQDEGDVSDERVESAVPVAKRRKIEA